MSNGVSNRPGIPDGLAKSSWNHNPRVGGSSPSSGILNSLHRTVFWSPGTGACRPIVSRITPAGDQAEWDFVSGYSNESAIAPSLH